MPKTEHLPETDSAKQERTGGEPAATQLDPATVEELAAASTVVLDTSVLMADPNSLFSYGAADVVIPLTVIDELDDNKGRLDDAGRNARTVLRAIEELRVANDGDISTAVQLPQAGTVRIEPNGLRLDELDAHHLDSTKPDHRIIAAALGLSRDGHKNVTLVSNDTGLRIKTAVLGVAAREYDHQYAARDHRKPDGWIEAHATTALVDALHRQDSVSMDELGEFDSEELKELPVNQFALLNRGGQSALVRRRGDGRLHLLPRSNSGPGAWGLRPKSMGQHFALNLLLDKDLPLVALDGAAGTGKSMLAVAAGLQQTFEEDHYSRMTILRPIYAVGKQDLGFLPGDLEDKLGPWFEAIIDTMVALSSTGQSHRDCRAMVEHWVDQDRLTLESVTYLRGRSLQGTYLLADEVQNYEPSVVKTIVTRLGEGSKGVLIGDVTQIDSPWTSEYSNGLTTLVRGFEGEAEFGHVTLTQGERSRIADLAADRL